MPPVQVRDMTVQRRESDLVLATFGRGFYVLDDYSPLRQIGPESLADETHLFGLRDAYLFNTTGLDPAGSASIGDLSGNFTTPNPPDGAVFTYHVNPGARSGDTLVILIRDENGEQVREMEVDGSPGLRRVEWDLRTDPPEPDPEQEAQAAAGSFRGRGRQAPLVEPGRYVASIGWKSGAEVVEIGPSQSFHVVKVDW